MIAFFISKLKTFNMVYIKSKGFYRSKTALLETLFVRPLYAKKLTFWLKSIFHIFRDCLLSLLKMLLLVET